MRTAAYVVPVALAGFFAVASAPAQDYPNRPIRMIVGFPPGGGTDVMARLVAPRMTETWSQQVVIDNRPGATGIIGTDLVAKAVPDGYTLLMGHVATNAIAWSLFAKLPFDPAKDFTPITRVSSVPHVLVVHPSLDARSVKDLIALAKAKPGELNYGSAGSGAATHLAAELFKSMAGVNLVHIPYRGPAEALNALVMNEAQVEIQSMLSATPFVQGGRLRLLATTGSKRLAEYPDVPTVAEAAVPGYAVYTWFGVVAPAGVPPPVLARLHVALVQALTSPEMRRQFTNQGAEVVANTPAEFSAFLREEVAKWNKVIRDSGARVD